jgi:hypothetical protein
MDGSAHRSEPAFLVKYLDALILSAHRAGAFL